MTAPRLIMPSRAARCRKKRRRISWPCVRAMISIPSSATVSGGSAGVSACELGGEAGPISVLMLGPFPVGRRSGQADARVEVGVGDVGEHVEQHDRAAGDDEERHD